VCVRDADSLGLQKWVFVRKLSRGGSRWTLGGLYPVPTLLRGGPAAVRGSGQGQNVWQGAAEGRGSMCGRAALGQLVVAA